MLPSGSWPYGISRGCGCSGRACAACQVRIAASPSFAVAAGGHSSGLPSSVSSSSWHMPLSRAAGSLSSALPSRSSSLSWPSVHTLAGSEVSAFRASQSTESKGNFAMGAIAFGSSFPPSALPESRSSRNDRHWPKDTGRLVSRLPLAYSDCSDERKESEAGSALRQQPSTSSSRSDCSAAIAGGNDVT